MKSTADYILATGRIRVLEKDLITSDALTRMIEARDEEEAFKVLSEFDYSDELLKESNPEKYEQVLAHDMMQTRQFVKEVVDDERVLNWLFSEHDFHNAKCMFKQKFFEEDLSSYISKLGNVDVEKLREAIVDESDSLPEGEFKTIIQDAQEFFSTDETKHPERVDAYLDQQYYGYLLMTAKELNDEFVLNLTKKRIDLANSKLMVRGKELEKDFAFIEERFIDGGTLNVDLYRSRFEDESNETFLLEVSHIFVSPIVEEYIKQALETGSYYLLEKAFEVFEASIASEGKKEAFGLEVLLAYVLAKKIANMNIRKVMVGKINGIPKEQILDRIIEFA
ncbi:V-type ATPase subunit [Patescibacteria group bacterium]|nr:V-type ATPase subunit [Patescibacteria group bacterium]